MTAPISFTVRPPTSSVPHRPSPLANGSRHNGRMGPPSRRLFDGGNNSDSDDGDDFGRDDRRAKVERVDRVKDEGRNGRAVASGYASPLLRMVLSPYRLFPFASPDAHRSSKPAAPLVIAALPNRDWRESSSRRVPSFRPEAPVRDASDLITHERIGDGQAKRGLERFGRKKEEGNEEDVKMEVKEEVDVEQPKPNVPDIKKEPLSLEEQALQELMAGEEEKESAEERAQRELVIAMQANNVRVLSESEALQRDIRSLPTESTLEDFEAVPISAFGIAALRGMGWDPKSTENVKAREVQRRPQLLGLGATSLEVSLPPGSGKSRKEVEREKEKREKKKTRDEKTGRGFSAASLLMKTRTPTPVGTPSGSGRTTPMIGSRAGSAEAGNGTGTDSDGSRRRRREDEGGSERDSKRRDDRDRERSDRYETDEERARRKAKERERYDRGDQYERSDRDKDRDRRDRDGSGRDREREKDRSSRDGDRGSRRERY